VFSHSIEKDKEERKTLEAFDLSSVKGMKFFDPMFIWPPAPQMIIKAMADAGVVAAYWTLLFGWASQRTD